MDEPVVAVVGPTATGKSELALDLAEALGAGATAAEVVNADAMQLYRGMDVGTAKLPVVARRGVPHHQLDVLDVHEEASVAAYQHHARADIAAIRGRGHVPLLVGGSGLYVRAVLDDLRFPGTSPEIRRRLAALAEARGPAALHAMLARADPEAAARILPGNVRRVVRALEVVELTGRPFTAALPEYRYAGPARQLAVAVPREELDRRIEARAAAMVRGGLVEETATLLAHGLGRTASRAVGYRQAIAVVEGLATAGEAVEEIAAATRRLARRQEKWFRRDPRIAWLDPGRPLVPQALTAIGR